ncbi:hypothetical protein Slin14017_G082880 [Septoria linicola]|nr:hypothetical protein Slin14017_G082880 [Septoria linicola]
MSAFGLALVTFAQYPNDEHIAPVLDKVKKYPDQEVKNKVMTDALQKELKEVKEKPEAQKSVLSKG